MRAFAVTQSQVINMLLVGKPEFPILAFFLLQRIVITDEYEVIMHGHFTLSSPATKEKVYIFITLRRENTLLLE